MAQSDSSGKRIPIEIHSGIVSDSRGGMKMQLRRRLTLNNVGEVFLAFNQEYLKSTQNGILGEWLRKYEEHITEICALFYGPRIVKDNHIMGALRRGFGIFAEEWGDFTVEGQTDIVGLLACESPHEEVDDPLTIPEALQTMHDLTSLDSKVDILHLFTRMDRGGAYVYWSRAFGQPVIPLTGIVRAVAHVTPYTRNRIRSGHSMEPLDRVLKKALNGELSEHFTVQAGIAFRGPTYAAWNQWTVPFTNTYVDIVKGPRFYVHRVLEGGEYRNRVYDMDGRLTPYDTPYDGLCGTVSAIGYCDDEQVLEYIFLDDHSKWASPLLERAVSPCPYIRVNDEHHLADLISSLEEEEYIRLVDGDRAHIHSGHTGGFIVRRRMHEMPLLIMEGRRQNEEYLNLKVAAMDGFNPVTIGTSNLRMSEGLPFSLYPIRNTPEWVSLLEDNIVGRFYALGMKNGRLRAPSLISVDENLGLSDVIQLGDIWSRVDNG
jgi:hypothetical protein